MIVFSLKANNIVVEERNDLIYNIEGLLFEEEGYPEDRKETARSIEIG